MSIPEIYVFAIGDTSLNATAPIRSCSKSTILSTNESVIVLTSWDFRASEPGSDLEGFRGRYGQHGMGQGGFELVENGLTQA